LIVIHTSKNSQQHIRCEMIVEWKYVNAGICIA
jgi:hypothetical protein